jgi:outer membrane protein TolC
VRLVFGAILLLISGSLFASGLTEYEAVEQGLRHPAIASQLDARRGIARGRLESAGRWDNPEIEYDWESLDSAGGSVDENSLLVRQRFDLAGVKRLERLSASLDVEAEEARIELTKRELVSQLREVFYFAMAAGQRQREVERWQARLQELALAISARVQAGDVSRYDETRVARELALLEGESLAVSGEAESARDGLATLIGRESFELLGQMLPPGAPPDSLPSLVDRHPLLDALGAEADSAAQLQAAASRERWPQVSLGLGYKETRQPGMQADGAMISLGIELPLFDRGQGRESVAQARSRLIKAQRQLEEQRLQLQARAILRRWQASIGAVDALGREQPHGLIGMAEAAYEAGEISVMELIDAWRADLDTQLQLIGSALAARRAYIEWQAFTGE